MVKILFKRHFILLVFVSCIGLELFGQYNANYVEASSTNIDGKVFAVVKMSRKDNHVKVKYFAAKDYNGSSVYQRYNQWKANKNIIAMSSGTYMTECDAAIAQPVGLCIDNGTLVSNTLRDDLDALVIVYATGGIAVSNLDEKNLTVTYTATSTKKILNIRNAFDRAEFINWAKAEGATVFQSHLFCYKNILQVYSNASSKEQGRRFLAGCKDENGNVIHFIINSKDDISIYDASIKAKDYLLNTRTEDMQEVVFIFNLDTGCQDVFEVKKSNGTSFLGPGFNGTVIDENTTNLIVYYYE